MNLTLDIPNVVGTSTITDHADEVLAIGIRDYVEARENANDRPKVAELLIYRIRDKATPKLAKACAQGTNLGKVKVNMFAADGTSLTVFAEYELTNCFISRYEMDTPDNVGVAYEPHDGWSVEGKAAARNPFDTSIVNDDRSYSRWRAAPSPTWPRFPGVPTEVALERLWLSGNTIKWTFKNGGISKGWDIAAGTEPAEEEAA